MLTINGVRVQAAGQTLASYLCTAGYDCSRIAVERNGMLVLRSQYPQTILADGDTIEIVCFVGGG